MSEQPKRKKYRVIYDRSDCIGAGACAAIHPRRWMMNKNDDLADLVGGKKIGTNPEQWEFEFSMDELDQMISSAQVCPVNVIHIIDLETGEKLI